MSAWKRILDVLLEDATPDQVKAIALQLADEMDNTSSDEEENNDEQQLEKASVRIDKVRKRKPYQYMSHMYEGVEYDSLQKLSAAMGIEGNSLDRIRRYARDSKIEDLADVRKHKPLWFPKEKEAKTILRKNEDDKKMLLLDSYSGTLRH